MDANYGGTDGTPIARFYIDGYMREIAPKLSGRILEFGMPTYSKYLNCDYEIIDIDRNNKSADIHADICNEVNCAPYFELYDHIICTAVLQLVEQPLWAVQNMHRMLKPGGSLILAEKALSRVDPWVPELDRWRFTHHGIDLLMDVFQKRSIHPFGNVYAACAYFYGLPAEAVDIDKLSFSDPNHVIVTIANGTK
jgi:SAM-dependent methyltransferase